jgi:LPS sulfotransferase NodH
MLLKKIFQRHYSSGIVLDLYLIYQKFIYNKIRLGNVAMFHTGRCGSTVLGNLLNQNPEISWVGEVFEDMQKRYRKYRWRKEKPLKILEIIMYSSECRYFGFETKSMKEQHLRLHWIDMNLIDYIGALCQLGFKHFIILKRRNYLKRAMSATVGFKSGIWHQKKDETNNPIQINIEINNFKIGNTSKHLLQHFRDLDQHYLELNSILEKKCLLNLIYEDDIQDNPISAYNKICDFLKIEPVPVEIRRKKTNPFKMSEVIKNFDEVKETLRNTKYEWMTAE